MSDRKINAAVLWNNGKVYFFEGNRYYRYSPGKRVDAGYPRSIAGNWKRWPSSFKYGVSAGLYVPGKKKAYFFRGNQYIRHTPGKGCDAGYPKRIRGNWKNWPYYFTSGISAALYRKDNKKYYFFKGPYYIRHTPGKGCDSGYPKKIKGNWKGMPTSFQNGVDAALWYTNNKIYFFKGEHYVRYTPKQGVDPGYPKLVGGSRWEGLFKRYTAGTVVEIVQSKLQGKIPANFKHLHLADGMYYFPEMEDVERVVNDTTVDTYTWTSQKFDCDDFAWVLKAEFAKDAYDDFERRAPHCVGVVWGDLPSPHAINWVITDDQQLWFIEPQNDTIMKPKKNHKNIWMMIS